MMVWSVIADARDEAMDTEWQNSLPKQGRTGKGFLRGWDRKGRCGRSVEPMSRESA